MWALLTRTFRLGYLPAMKQQSSAADAWLTRAVGPQPEGLCLSEPLWTEVAPLLGSHRAAGLLYDRVCSGTIQAPRMVRYELSAYVSRWLNATRDWPGLAGGVLDGLRRRGVPHLVLKGWALIPLVNGGRRELREVCDMDVLITRASLAEADAVLRAQGFAIPPQGEVRTGFAHKYSHEAQYVCPCGERRPMGVDLHWQAMNDPRFWPLVGHDWPARARALDVEGVRFTVPAAEDLFLHLCGHDIITHARDSVQPLYRKVDLLRVTRQPGFDWPTVVERAREFCLTGSMRTCVDALDALWPGAVSKSAKTLCAGLTFSPDEAHALKHAMSRFSALRPSPGLRWIPGWRARVEYLSGKLFPSGAYLRSAHNLPPNASYLRGLAARYGSRLSTWRQTQS